MHVHLIALNPSIYNISLFCMGFKGHHVPAYRVEPGAGDEANVRLQCTIFLVDTPSTYMYTRVIMAQMLHHATCKYKYIYIANKNV